MRLLDAGIYHFLEDICVLCEVDQQLLLFLHVSVGVCVNLVGVVEKEVVLACELYSNVLDLVRTGASLRKV